MSRASATALKNWSSICLCASGRRVMAKAKASAKIISGSTASSAAAAMALVGISARRNSLNGGTSPGGAAVPRAERSAIAASPSSGKSSSRAGVTTAAIADEHQRMKIMNPIARAVIRPARAMEAALPMPTTRRVKTSGITVMRRALSHILPTTSAASTNKLLLGPKKRPARMPKTRARSMISAFFNIFFRLLFADQPSTMAGGRWQALFMRKFCDCCHSLLVSGRSIG